MGKKRKSVATSLDEADRSMYTTFCAAANSLSQLYTHSMNHQKFSFQAGERQALDGFNVGYGELEVLIRTRSDQLIWGALQVVYRPLLLGLSIGHYSCVIMLGAGGILTIFYIEKLYQWILRQQEGGSRVTTPDVVNYLQHVNWDVSNGKLGRVELPSPYRSFSGEADEEKTELDFYGEEPSMSPRPPAQNQHLMHFMNPGSLASSGAGVAAAGQGFRSEACDQQPKNYVFSNALSSPVRRSLQNYHISQGGYFSNSALSSANVTRTNEPNSNQNQNRDANSFNSNDSNMDMHADSPSHEY